MAGISAIQQKAIEYLLTGSSVVEAAKLAGVGERSLTRWLADDEAFKAALQQAQTAAFDAMVTRLSGLGEIAVVALQDGMGALSPLGLRVKAGISVIDRLLAIREFNAVEELSKRLAALEENSAGGK